MGDILTAGAGYEAVRQALGVDVTVVDDNLIEGLAYLPLVETEVKALVPDWSAIITAAGADALRLKVGVAYWIAARLCGYLERQEKQSYRVGQISHNASSLDWRIKSTDLSIDSARYLATVSTQTPAGRPTLFTVSGPTRSRTNVPVRFDEWLDKVTATVVDWLIDENTSGVG